METDIRHGEHPPVACPSCGRQFRYKPELAGRTVSCPCGSVMRIAAPQERVSSANSGATDDEDIGEYDFAPQPPAHPPASAHSPGPAHSPGRPRTQSPAHLPDPVRAQTPAHSTGPVHTQTSAHSTGPSNLPAQTVGPAGDDALDAPLPSDRPAIAVNLPPQRRGLQPEARKTNEELAPPSNVRDFILPSILIVVGVALHFFETMSPSASAQPLSFGPAVGVVAVKLALSVGMLLGGMFLAVQIAEVCFIGALHRTAYKLVGIAVGPGAIYGILSFMGGDTYGAMIGTFVSIALYGMLFWFLMRLDIKDAGICVLVTWILITAANYAAYKFEGIMRDSWV